MAELCRADRCSLLKAGALAGTALAAGTSGFAQLAAASSPTAGDVAILRFCRRSKRSRAISGCKLQYAELGGAQVGELPGLSGGTEDEFSHHAFVNAFLQFIGAKPVALSKFKTIPGSQATGAAKTTSGSPVLRLTNLCERERLHP
jgi:hypothetical protein